MGNPGQSKNYRERPVQRLAVTSASAMRHRVLTVISVKGDSAAPPAVRQLNTPGDPLVLEIVQDNIAARLADAAVTADALWGWHEPGELLLAVQKDNVTIATHAF